MNEEHFRKLENMYLNASINRELYPGTEIEIRKGRTEIRIPISDKYYHALGAMHGSVYFKLLDDAAFFAANSMVENYFVLTKSFEIHFLRPVKQGLLRARGKFIHSREKDFCCESELYDENEKIIARGNGIFVRSIHKLVAEIGYE